ncbi:hypothetical protein [Actinomadura sp. 9N215]|uniref:hypothetical protein n=1 Tax=Actinomadura sp. 9N215 TaxID=3375150 RepID=UPI0037B7F8C2
MLSGSAIGQHRTDDGRAKPLGFGRGQKSSDRRRRHSGPALPLSSRIVDNGRQTFATSSAGR